MVHKLKSNMERSYSYFGCFGGYWFRFLGKLS